MIPEHVVVGAGDLDRAAGRDVDLDVVVLGGYEHKAAFAGRIQMIAGQLDWRALRGNCAGRLLTERMEQGSVRAAQSAARSQMACRASKARR